jgi:redox-sensitive bicupin YhaK (pirin superfamily)
MMKLIGMITARIAYPTGNPNFAVQQAFPASFRAEQTDPFLMCDFFGPTKSEGKEKNPDQFPVDWHPHRGMDVLTYLIEGIGRHADSLGNREEFTAPGMQWCAAGSGIEHAEGGGTPLGENQTGFQIWVNVPSSKKMDDPRYGTVPNEAMPVFRDKGIYGRILAGKFSETLTGPFETTQPVQMVDFVLEPNSSFTHEIPIELDNLIVFVYNGGGSVNDQEASKLKVLLFDAGNKTKRSLQLKSGTKGMSLMMFAGKKLNQPIAWQGPFVMTTEDEIRTAMKEYRMGTFLKKRAAWDYKTSRRTEL